MPATVLVFLLIVAFWTARTHYLSRRSLQGSFSPLHYLHHRLVITALDVVFFYYPAVTVALLSAFQCRTLDVPPPPGSPPQLLTAVGSWWMEDYSVKCFSGGHRLLAFGYSVPGAWVGGRVGGGWWRPAAAAAKYAGCWDRHPTFPPASQVMTEL